MGTWQWGNKLLWGYDEKDDSDLREVFSGLCSVVIAVIALAVVFLLRLLDAVALVVVLLVQSQAEKPN